MILPAPERKTMKKEKVWELKTILERSEIVLIKKELDYPMEKNEKFTSPGKVADLMRAVFQIQKQTEEYLYMMCLDIKGRLLGIYEIAHGCINAIGICRREIFQKALLVNAVSIILIHNHPSGDPTPSSDDIKLHHIICEGSRILNIDFLDGIIIGSTSQVSLKSSGYL